MVLATNPKLAPTAVSSAGLSPCHHLSLALPFLSAEIVNMIKSHQCDYACVAGFAIRGNLSLS